MSKAISKPATYADLLAVPEPLIGEILDGELHTQPRPSARHALIASDLGAALIEPFRRGRGGPGGWWIIDEPEIHLGADVLVPDLAGWRRERLPTVPDRPHFDLVPDWVCEILSPSTARKDRVVKLPRYAIHGVRHAWLIDPAGGTLEAYELQEQRWMLSATIGRGDKARIPPFDAVELDLDEFLAAD